jgi:hypothetical protein
MDSDDPNSWHSTPLKPGERLFVEFGGPGEIALAAYDLSETRYILSFREAAEALSANALTRRGVPDLLLFPILFAYRHWLELQLKAIIQLGYRWRDEEAVAVGTHDLEPLWSRARSAIEDAFPGDASELDEIGPIISEVAEVDRRSESFRYPHNRDGEINLPRSLNGVNLRHLARVMTRVGVLLDGAATGMDELLAAADDHYGTYT